MPGAICAGLLLLTLTGCSGSSGNQLGDLRSGQGIEVIPARYRGAPIRLGGDDLDGRPLELPLRSNTATVLNVWWSRCAACRVEARTLRTLGSTHHARLFGIDVRESSRAEARRFAESASAGIRSFFDPGGRLLLLLGPRASVAAIPSSFVLDRHMRLAAVIYGVLPRSETFRDLIAEVLRGDA